MRTSRTSRASPVVLTAALAAFGFVGFADAGTRHHLVVSVAVTPSCTITGGTLAGTTVLLAIACTSGSQITVTVDQGSDSGVSYHATSAAPTSLTVPRPLPPGPHVPAGTHTDSVVATIAF